MPGYCWGKQLLNSVKGSLELDNFIFDCLLCDGYALMT